MEYQRCWKYSFAPEEGNEIQSGARSLDIYARAKEGYSLIGEVKNREGKKFSLEEVKNLEKKIAIIRENDQLTKTVGFIFSRNGLTEEAEQYCLDQKIAFSSDENWYD